MMPTTFNFKIDTTPLHEVTSKLKMRLAIYLQEQGDCIKGPIHIHGYKLHFVTDHWAQKR